MRILLVENHPDTRHYLARHLARAGHEVETAETCADAHRSLQTQPPDLLITDIGLPDGDGWILLEQLDGARPRLAISMSGNNNPDVRQRSQQAGFQRHLIKPFLPDDFDQALQDLTEEARQTDST